MSSDDVSAAVALLALAATVGIAIKQYQLGTAQRDLAAKQVELAATTAQNQRELTTQQIELTARTAKTEQELAIAHAGAQTAMLWRDQVWALHDRGLDPEEIRWIMCCEDYGVGYEEWNGIIEEIVGNVPRVVPVGVTEPLTRSPHRRLPRPQGGMRADLGQDYGFQVEHPDK